MPGGERRMVRRTPEEFGQLNDDDKADAQRTAYAMVLATERRDERAVGDLWRTHEHDSVRETYLRMALTRIPGEMMRLLAMTTTGNMDVQVDTVSILERVVAALAAGERVPDHRPLSS
jgi:hypothetical protein